MPPSVKHDDEIEAHANVDDLLDLRKIRVPFLVNGPAQQDKFVKADASLCCKVRDGADQMFKWVAELGVETFAGADLWQEGLITRTPDDMVLRKRWFPDVEILRQNTSSAGRWLAKSGTKNPYRKGPLGVIAEGAYADMLLVDGNPVADVSVMADWKKNIRLIIKDGEIYKNTL